MTREEELNAWRNCFICPECARTQADEDHCCTVCSRDCIVVEHGVMKFPGDSGAVTMRDVAAYLLDRADQYDDGSGCWVAVADCAHNVAIGEVVIAKNEGELDSDLYERVDRMSGAVKPVIPDSGKDPDDADEEAAAEEDDEVD